MKTKLIATLAVVGVFSIGAGAAFAYGPGDCPYGNTPGSGTQVQKKANTKTGERKQLRMRDGTGPRHGKQAAQRQGKGAGNGSQLRERDGSCRS